MGAGTILKGAFNCSARRIGCMQDAPVTVPTFLVQVKLPALGFGQTRKIDTEIDQPADTFSTVLYNKLDHVGMT